MLEVEITVQILAGQLKDARIVVVGAGAIGSVVSYRLAQAGARVTVIDRRSPGSGTTGNSFAWLNSFEKMPRDYHRLNVRSTREHLELADEIGGDYLHVDGGLHWSHRGDAQRNERIHSAVRRLRAWGYRVERATPEQVMRDLEPDLFVDPERVEEVFVLPGEGWVSGVGLCHGAVSAAVRRYGAQYVQDHVTGLSGPKTGAIDRVALAGGQTLSADVVINAAGPDAARLAALAGVKLPIRRQLGVLVATEPAPVNLRMVVHAPEMHVHPDGGYRLLLHRESYDHVIEEGQTLTIDHPLCAQAIVDALPILPGLRDVRAEGVRVGIRPMPLDGLPIVGFDPDVSGLYHVVMHSGVTLSALVGLLVTEELSGSELPELAPYRLSRFAGVLQATTAGE
ncbi:MAG: FAD-binding oxidoreductase [Chloroflexi bacterium]|nr:FAD-binding oxidoreductase [Chloroflexota bacterium]